MSGNTDHFTEPEDLRAEFFSALEGLSRSAQSMSAMLVRVAELGEDFGLDVSTMGPIVEPVDELARRVAALRPPDDP